MICTANPSLLTARQRRIRFFAANAGYSVPPGKLVCAARLADAEIHAEKEGWAYIWEDDDMGWDGDCPAPEELFGCILHDEDGNVLESLWSIGDPSAEYRRVVEAELALQAMPS